MHSGQPAATACPRDNTSTPAKHTNNKMASPISDEPVVQLQALERALSALTAKQTAAFGAR
jgi:hypothetical protein